MKKMINFSLLFIVICSLHIPFIFSRTKQSQRTEELDDLLLNMESSQLKHKKHESRWLKEQLDQPSLSKYRGKRLLQVLDLLGLDTNTLQNLDLSEQQIKAIQNIVLCND